jgi:hypothetical protein
MEYETTFCPWTTFDVPVTVPAAPGTVWSIVTDGVKTGAEEPAAFLAVNVYTPAAAVVIFVMEGLCKEEINPFGPVQFQKVAPMALPVKVKVLPAQRAVELGMGVTPAGRLCEVHIFHQPERL